MPEHRYRIVISGHIGEIFRLAFEGMTIESDGDCTVLIGDLDQPALHATFSRVNALGLELIEAVRLPPAGEDA